MIVDRDILLKFLKCECTESEERAVLDWLDQSEENRAEMQRLDRLFAITVLHTKPHIAPQKRKGLAIVMPIVKWAVGVAAAVVMLIAGAELYSTYKIGEISERMATVVTPLGERVEITLQDGTQVWLNSGTVLEYPTLFAKSERRVRVSGEALFEVEHDAERPFIVETYACDVEVLGTTFCVEADAERNGFVTSLLEGSVRVVNRLSKGDEVTLKPNEQVRLLDGELCVANIANSDDFLWTKGVLSLDESSFDELVLKLERAYDVDIVLNRESTPNIHYRGKVRINDGIEHALNILKLESDFTYQRNVAEKRIYIE